MEVEVRSRLTVNQWKAKETGVVISISEPRSNHPLIEEKPELKEVLRLSFHDIDIETSEFDHSRMTDEDAKLVATFVEKHKNVDMMIVQCDAGISRSSGIAAAILKHLTGDDSQIFNDKRFLPNRWVYSKTLEALAANRSDNAN